MKLKHKKEGRLQKGITLIALVITIIVLLILAGVSIATLTGNNGILTKAQTAKTETEQASEEEQIQLAAMNAAMNTERYNYKVEDGTVPIPAGFAPTQIEGENTIAEGVVVVDEKGNEFVWIPCTIDEFNKQRNTEEGWSSKQYSYNGTTSQWGDSQPNQEKIQNSIKNKEIGGFYIGRYEAGVPKEATEFYANSDGASYKRNTEKNADNSYIPVSKKGVQAWNYIDQTHAKNAAERMIRNNGVQSYLIDSHAWDTTCRIIKKYDKTKNLLDSTEWGNYYNNKTTKYENLNTLYALHTYDTGWHFAETYSKGQVPKGPKGVGTNRLELSTGASDDFKAYNIYDLAGNMWEWTTENGNNAGGNKPTESMPGLQITDVAGAKNGVIRGGSFGDNGGGDPVVRSGGDPTTSNCFGHLGFRVVLYLQPSNK